MKHNFYSFVLAAALLFSCSSDDSGNNGEQLLDVEVTTVSDTKLFYNDIVTIFGKNFNPNISNTITINNLEQEVTYFTDNEIKIKIGEGATSGDIVLSNTDGSAVLATVRVASENVYRRIRAQMKKIDLRYGTPINESFNPACEYADSIGNLVQNPTTNDYICFSIYVIDGAGSSETSFNKYNLETGGCINNLALDINTASSLMFSNDGRLYGGLFSSESEIIEINPETGGKIQTIVNIDRLMTLVYDSSDNTVLFTNEMGDFNFLHRYNLDTQQHSILEVEISIDQLYAMPDGRLLATGRTPESICNRLVEINKQTGEVMETLYEVAPPACGSPNKRLRYMHYLPSVDMLLIDFTKRHLLYDFETKEGTIYQTGELYRDFLTIHQ